MSNKRVTCPRTFGQVVQPSQHKGFEKLFGFPMALVGASLIPEEYLIPEGDGAENAYPKLNIDKMIEDKTTFLIPVMVFWLEGLDVQAVNNTLDNSYLPNITYIAPNGSTIMKLDAGELARLLEQDMVECACHWTLADTVYLEVFEYDSHRGSWGEYKTSIGEQGPLLIDFTGPKRFLYSTEGYVHVSARLRMNQVVCGIGISYEQLDAMDKKQLGSNFKLFPTVADAMAYFGISHYTIEKLTD